MRDNRKYICEECGWVDESATRVVERSEAYNVKGESIPVLARVRVCETCNEEISDEVLDDITLQAAFDIYRRKHRIISPAEIRDLRQTYGLSQRGLGAILDWGPITIHRYEAGSLPDESHNQVLRLLQDPFNMARLVAENPEAIDADTYRKILDHLESLLPERVPAKVAEILGQGSQKKASIFTGFRDFDPDTLMEMMIFFAREAGGVLKTKLNKLLWYADFAHYKHHTVSISGAAYSHYTYGPVPQNYEAFLSALCASDALVIEEIDLGTTKGGEEMTGHNLIASRDARLSGLSQAALNTLYEVHNHFAHMGSKRISKLSHEEEGYIRTKYKELISYEYADALKVDPLTPEPKKTRKKRTKKPRDLSPEVQAALAAILKRFGKP